jgi:hypothetical protein
MSKLKMTFRLLRASSSAFARPSFRSFSSAFNSRVSTLFDTIERGVEDMKEDNVGFTVTRTGDEELQVELGGVNGSFFLQTLVEEETVTMMTPMGTASTYKFSSFSETWAAEADQHNLYELMARDLVQLCKGYPKF